jgi:hypothetical protein
VSESTLALMLDARKAKRQAAAAIAKRQRFRLAEAVAHARSPFYREFYGELPECVDEGADTRDAAELSQGELRLTRSDLGGLRAEVRWMRG